MGYRPQRGRAWHQQRTVVPPYRRTSADGILHPSESHMTRWNELKLLESRGLVRNLMREVRFPLSVHGRPIKTPTGRTRVYTADFVYERLTLGEWVRLIEEHKGYMDATSELRIAVFEACYDVTVTIHK